MNHSNSSHPSPTYITPRLSERGVADEHWIRAMLHGAPFGSLGMLQAGHPYVKPTLFVYDETAHAVYFHGALEGRTHTALEAHPEVCFTISQLGRLLPAKTAMEFSIEYNSVIVFGAVQIVEGEEALTALQLLMDKYFTHLRPDQDYQPTNPEELALTSVYRIAITSWSGKAHHAAPDYPGAFYYERPGLQNLGDFA